MRRGGHRRRGRPQVRAHRRHALRPEPADRARADGLSGARDLGGDRAEDQGRRREAQPVHGAAGPRGSDVPVSPSTPRPARRSSRDGRAAPRDHRRPPPAGVQGRGQRRAAGGGLPRDDPPEGRGPRAVRARRQAAGASTAMWRSRWSPRRARVRLREQDRGRLGAARVHPGRGEGHPGGAGKRGARRLPGRRRPGVADGRVVPRRRLLRDGVQDRGLDGVQGRGEARPARCSSSPSCRSRW